MAKPLLIVTGGSGLIGSAFARAAYGVYEIRNLDITEGIDITDATQVEECMREDGPVATVVHFAAFADVSAAHKQNGNAEGSCYRINVIGTRNVVQACNAVGAHLIHISTDFVFDGSREDPYDEQSSPHPIEWYGATKRMAEEEVMSQASSWTIARIAFPYTGIPAPKLDLVRTLRDKLSVGETIKAFPDQIITPTCLDDVVEGVLLLARERVANEIFHLVGSTSLSPFDLGKKIAEVYGFDESLVHPYALEEHLKIDPRPRQKCLRVSNAKWSAFAVAHHLPRPLTIDEGLERIRAATLVEDAT